MKNFELKELSAQELENLNGGSLEVTVKIVLAVLSKPFTLWA